MKRLVSFCDKHPEVMAAEVLQIKSLKHGTYEREACLLCFRAFMPINGNGTRRPTGRRRRPNGENERAIVAVLRKYHRPMSRDEICKEAKVSNARFYGILSRMHKKITASGSNGNRKYALN